MEGSKVAVAIKKQRSYFLTAVLIEILFGNQIGFVEYEAIEVFGKVEALSDQRFEVECYSLSGFASAQIVASRKLQLSGSRVYDKKYMRFFIDSVDKRYRLAHILANFT